MNNLIQKVHIQLYIEKREYMLKYLHIWKIQPKIASYNLYIIPFCNSQLPVVK